MYLIRDVHALQVLDVSEHGRITGRVSYPALLAIFHERYGAAPTEPSPRTTSRGWTVQRSYPSHSRRTLALQGESRRSS